MSSVREKLGNVSDTSRAYLITEDVECRRALGMYYKAFGIQHDTTHAYAIRTADSGYVVIVPGRMSGEWQDSYWFDRNGKMQPVVLGL